MLTFARILEKRRAKDFPFYGTLLKRKLESWSWIEGHWPKLIQKRVNLALPLVTYYRFNDSASKQQKTILLNFKERESFFV